MDILQIFSGIESPINPTSWQLLLNPVGKRVPNFFSSLKTMNLEREGKLVMLSLIVKIIQIDDKSILCPIDLVGYMIDDDR